MMDFPIHIDTIGMGLPKWIFLYFKPILVAIFVTIATVKFCTLAILLTNQLEEIGEKQLSVFYFRGGGGGGGGGGGKFDPLCM